MPAGSIVVDLLMRTGSFETDTARAEKSLAKFKKEALETAKQAGAVLGTAAVAVGGALALMTKQAIDAADEINKLSQKTGESAETLSALSYAFELGDVSGEAFGSSMIKLSRSMSEAAQGSGDAAVAFNVLGVAVKNADGSLRPTADVLGDVAQKFAEFADGPEKSALAIAIFGKSGADLIPVLNAGKDGLKSMADEAKQLGIVISGETARAAEEFNDTLTKIGKGANAAGQQLAAQLLPTLQTVATEFLNFQKEGNAVGSVLEFIGDAAKTSIETLVILGANVAFVFKGVGREVGAIAAQVVALASLDIKGFNAISEAVKSDAARARAELDAFERRVLGARLPDLGQSDPRELARRGRSAPAFGAPAAPRLPGGGPSRSAGSAAASTRSVDDYQSDIARSVGNAITNSDVVRAKELADQVAYLDKLYFDAGLSAEIYESAMRKLTGQTSGAKDVTSEFVEEQKRLAELLGSTASAKLEEQRSDMILLAKAYEEGRISVEQFTEAVEARLGTANEVVKETKTAAQELGMTFASAFEEAIVQGESLSDTLKGLLQDILRISTRKIVTEPLANFFSGSIDGIVASLFGGGFATGGRPPLGKVSVVGENGPELFVPDGAGTIVPNNAARREYGGKSEASVNIQVVNNTGTQAKARVERRPDGGMRVILDAVKAELLNDVSNGGQFGRGLEMSLGVRRAPQLSR